MSALLSAPLSALATTSTSSVLRDLLHLVDRPGVMSLAGGLPAAESFPIERLSVAAERAFAVGGTYGATALQYGPTEGDAELRAVLAETYACEADDLLVTTGSQQGLDLIARAVIDPGDTVVVEAPSYVGALQALRTCRPSLHAVPLDHDGLVTDDLARALRTGLRPKLVYVIPNFQNPSGATLTEQRRQHLLELADRYGFLIVEDDPYGALRFRGEAVRSLWQLGASTDRVASLGTASKLLAPGLRVGWLAAPSWLRPPLVRLKQATDLHTSSLCQGIVADVLADAAFVTAHRARLAELYGTRCSALLEALPPQFTVSPPDGGMFLWAEVPGVDASASLPAAIDAGVAYVPGTAFSIDGGFARHVRLSFATVALHQLPEAGRRLRTVLHAGAPVTAGQ